MIFRRKNNIFLFDNLLIIRLEWEIRRLNIRKYMRSLILRLLKRSFVKVWIQRGESFSSFKIIWCNLWRHLFNRITDRSDSIRGYIILKATFVKVCIILINLAKVQIILILITSFLFHRTWSRGNTIWIHWF